MTPKGYKQTELGILPEDWEVVRLGDVCDFLKTYSKSRSELSEFQECIDSVNYIHYGDIHTKFKHFLDMNKDTLPSIDLKKLEKKLENIVFVKNGDLIIADASEDYDDIGKSVEIKNLSSPTVSGLHTILCRDKSNHFANGYKGYIFSLYSVHKQIKRLACGISVLGISKSNLSKVQIPLPPLAEQEKIARVLSTWDTQIQNLQSLITQKQNLKKGLCQILLTAKTRFKGFDKPWQVVRLGEVCEILAGGDVPKYSFSKVKTEEYQIPILSNGIGEKALYGFTNQARIEKPCITISARGTIGYCSLQIEPFYPIVRLIVVLPKTKLDSRFLYYATMFSSIEGTKSGIPQLTIPMVAKNQIPLPPLAEQEKIAEILSTLDTEIENLKCKQKVIITQKKGLMQTLLKGKMRIGYEKK